MSDSSRSRRPLAVFDIDNTLADTAHRQHCLERRPRDWKGFFRAAPADPPLDRGVALALEADAECEVVYLTGRPEHCRADTLDWLTRHGLPEGQLWMRGNSDRRPARMTKVETLQRIARGREVKVLVDDDELVCQAVRAAGFPVLLADWAAKAPELRLAQEGAGRT
ncbi:HAD family acid phosphatase [Streptomyces sp. NPDC089799]|uniref:phosphatase domain-containing protein n=1 Tax=Streptomyces sp. NPDC089799 TaxID=3155066 RepID=UPI00342B952D